MVNLFKIIKNLLWTQDIESEWYGIKNECCEDDKNILQGQNHDYGQCIICFRIFERKC